MNSSCQNVLHYLTGCSDINAVTIEELQTLVEENPYFSVTRLLLAQKLKAENHAGASKEIQKTALYFSNPYWLDYQLSDNFNSKTGIDETLGNAQEVDEKDSNASPLPSNRNLESEGAELNIVSNNILVESPVSNRSEIQKFEIVGKSSHKTPANSTPPEITDGTVEQDKTENNTVELDQQYEPSEKLVSQPEEEASVITRDIDKKTEQSLAELSIEQQPVMQDTFEQVVLDSLTPSGTDEAIKVSEEMAGASQQLGDPTIGFLNESEKRTAENTEELVRGDQEPLPNNDSKVVNEESYQKEETVEPDEHERMFQNIKAMLDASSDEADADVENAVVPIDPYYTIDYFASQGIKLDLEQNPKDQLGKNLKKFTQWLKHMKKLGPEDATEIIIKKETEDDIVKIADSSNKTREVVTEAMASVLEKQGKKDKAIELYNKLSFLNPNKSAYFAHKIKSLQGT